MHTETIEVHRKLVRDKIPERILDGGDRPQWWSLVDDDEYLRALRSKVVEEATEVRDASPSERGSGSNRRKTNGYGVAAGQRRLASGPSSAVSSRIACGDGLK